MVLRQAPSRVETTKDGYQIKNLIGSKVDYRLAPSTAGDQAEIRNKGLVTGFGIFGAPGTGKTHLVLHILKGLLDEVQPDPELKFGGLILDPKAGLLDDVRKLWRSLGKHRAGDLILLKPEFLTYLSQRKNGDPAADSAPPIFQAFENIGVGAASHPTELNVIDCALSPTELGRMLVLAAQSAGVAAKEPFWFLAWTNLFGAALTLLEHKERYVPTVKRLLEKILLPDPNGQEVPNVGKLGASGKRRERFIEVIAREAREKPAEMIEQAKRSLRRPEDQIQADLAAAAAQIESFFQSDYVRTLEAFITNAFGGFQQFKFWCLSQPNRRVSQKYGIASGEPSFYDQIIEQGKVVLVSIGPEDPGMGKMLCTLVKCLFQQSVMSRLERFNSGKLKNFKRPLFIACDEYAEVASEVPGQPMGDGRFFSLSRQNGCMGLLATQSIHMLENSSLAESWKSIFSNLAAKIFMGAADNETAEQACNLAGQLDWEMNSTTENFGKENSFSHQRSYQQRPELTPYVLTHVLSQGEAVILGSLDGRETPPELKFIKVPQSFEIRRYESALKEAQTS